MSHGSKDLASLFLPEINWYSWPQGLAPTWSYLNFHCQSVWLLKLESMENTCSSYIALKPLGVVGL